MGLAMLALGQPTAAASAPQPLVDEPVMGEAPTDTAVDPLPFIALAIYEGRLVQARAMLDNIGTPETADEAEIALLLAELALAQGDRAAAMQRLEQIGDLPERLRCRLDAARGQLALDDDDHDRAIGWLGDATAACPHDWRSWNRLAILLDIRGESDASLYAFDQALVRSRGALKVRGNLALFLMRHNERQDARRVLDEALAEAPSDARLQALMIRLDAMEGNLPVRDTEDTAERWAEKLAIAGEGARDANRIELARKLFSQALLAAPRFDAKSWASLQSLMETNP